jgi:flagellar basal-body rod protein FlgF
MSNDGIITAASAMAGLERQLDLCAKNLANARTPGFQPHMTVTKSFEGELDDSEQKLVTTEEAISFGHGAVVPDEGNPLAVAIDGDGFFEVDTPQGLAYTRNGDFTLGTDGTLVTRAGYEVRGEGGPIRASEGGGEVSIAADGVVKQGDAEIGRLRLTEFTDRRRLEPVSDTLYRPASGAGPATVETVALKPSSLEYADETAVTALVDLIKIHRQFDATQHVLQSISDTYQQRIRALG